MRELKKLLSNPSATSLELVELLNALRDESEPRSRHDHFKRKVRGVLGANARKFEAKYQTKTGEHSCYVFPRREACLMVMSYGYALQAKMFDLLKR